MEVAISALRARLSHWIERACNGEEIIVTERGKPVARLMSVDTAPLLERLTQQGVLSKPRSAGRPSAHEATRVRAQGPVSDLVGEHRR
ncbi:type II toxin-antitoxin system Phd/YefM family antitoxin [Brevibacterium sp.]|uniref:type II toxin-antitoxin system Phd/YefM family antitoxin n=1 Tax=Brevibacterium sp. TaxID=1701 RepID=UPI0035C7DDCE